MSITIQCPKCRTRFRCKDKLAGKQVPCLKCHTLLTIPEGTVQKERPELSIFDEIEFKSDLPVWDTPWKPPQWESGFVSQLSKVKDSRSSTHPIRWTAELPQANPDGPVFTSPGMVLRSILRLSVIVVSVLFLISFIHLFL